MIGAPPPAATETLPRVALNAVAARTGGGLSFLLGQLPQLETRVDLTVFANAQVADELRRVLHHAEVRSLPGWAHPLPLRLLWEHVVFPRAATGAEVLYSIGSFTSFTARKPQVVVVLIPYVFGSEGVDVLRQMNPPLSYRMRIGLQRLLGRATLRQASVLVGASQFTAAQIHASARSRRVKVSVVPIAGGTILGDEDFALRLGVARPFALSVGSDQPHKDRLGLIESWPADSPLDLLLVGRCDRRGTAREMQDAIARRSNVHWFKSIKASRDISTLYLRANAVIAHSHLEGFGMTTLEAMAAETPVIASNIPPHREVCGDAALYYDPSDPESLAVCVRRLCDDRDVAKQLIEAGHQRLERFGWELNAAAMADLLTRAARDGVPGTLPRP